MIPRFRAFVLLLALLSAPAAPAAAAANPWVSLLAAPTACGPDPGPFAALATDTTTVPAGWRNADVEVTLTGSSVQGFEWKLDCGPTQATGNANIAGNGTFRFSHRAQETGTGDWTPWVDDTVSIDKTTPVNATTTSSAWRTGPVSVPLTVSDDISAAHGEWKIGADPLYTVSNTATVTGTGTHTLHTSAVDEAGNRDDRSHTVRIDDTLPVDTTVVPAGWQQDVAQITLDGTDTGDQSGVARMVYELDGGMQTPANAGDTLTITANGQHTLRTKVVDNAGNQSDWRNHIVQVDSAGPLDTTTVPSGWVRTPTVDVSIAGTDGNGGGVTRIEWELVEDARSGTVNGAGPVGIQVSGEGVHTLRTRLTDAQGHDSGWKVQTISIDTVLPVDHTSASSAWLAQTSLPVTVHGTDAAPGSGVARVEYRVDGAAGFAAGATGTALVTGTGEHVVETRVVDVAGNATGWVAHHVRLDPTSPANLTPAAPAGWRTDGYSVVLNGADENSGVASVQWRVNHGVVREGTVRLETAIVTGDGVHTLSTRVKDVAGNFSSWRDETIRIDTVKPTDTTAISGSPVPNGRKIPITATDAGSGPSGAVEWQLDAGAIKTASAATIVGPGPHTLRTRVQDNAGNWSDWRVSTVTVNPALPYEDSDAPVDNTTIPTNWRTGPVTVTVTADDEGGTGVDYVEWRIGGSAIVPGANGAQFTLSEDGVHEIETRATDLAGNTGPWRAHTLRIDKTLPVDTSALPAEWANTRTLKLTATDATSGVNRIEYRVNGGTPVQVAAAEATINLPADGTFTIARRVTDHAGQQTAWTTSTIKIDTVIPINTSGAAPAGWQNTPISLDLTGTDAGAGVERLEWRIGAGEIQAGSPAVVSADGLQTLRTRAVDKAGNASAWRDESVRVDLTKPTNTTPAVTSAWRNSTFTTTVTGTDATSGVLGIEWKLEEAASPSTTPAVSITAEGAHKLYTRVLDHAGNASDWREDAVGIDKTAPALAVDCGAATWRNTPVACTVVASGGISGLPTLTGARGGVVTPVTGDQYAVDDDGSSTIAFRAVDGAGNEATATGEVKVDRTAPVATVACTPDPKTLNYTCTANGSDALSGLAALTWSVNGSAPVAVAPGATFTVAKGSVVVTAADGAGNAGASGAVALADRRPPAPPVKPRTPEVTPRTASEAVLLRGKASASARLIGQLALSATPKTTTVDLRPLALGKGTFRFALKITSGTRTKTVSRIQKTIKGYSTRITVKVPAAATAKVALTVHRQAGKRWVAHAGAGARLG